jgi:predicted nucleotide-binding protein
MCDKGDYHTLYQESHMARQKPEPPAKQPASLSPQQLQAGIERLKKCIERVEAFDPNNVKEQHNIPHVEKLAASLDEALVRTFGADSLDYERYKNAAYFSNGPHNYRYPIPIAEVQRSLARSRESSIALLEQAVESLQERLVEASSLTTALDLTEPEKVLSRRVFVVHGHDDGPREAVARFLDHLGFEPIILHEQASGGRTIIEKIEHCGDVGFAVVLLTPDDDGCEKGGTPRPRARQNVIMELMYFIGRLGRDRVCALTCGDLELPSDFGGVVYVSFDANGGWKLALSKELEAAGFDIDWNTVMRS